MGHRVYIDGHAGTTGLRIREWLAGRDDIDLLVVPERLRKDVTARREHLLAAEVAVLCLPDDIAREVATWVGDSGTKLIDSSTAHRVADGWVYGLPELAPEHRTAICSARRVANPGCYSSAFIMLMRPLIDAGAIGPNAAVTIHALSGYSGGGRALIEKWEDPGRELLSLSYEAPYALDRVHKHIPEMIRYSGLQNEPQFVPAVGPLRCGMRVQVPLHAGMLGSGHDGSSVWEILHERYRNERFVRVRPFAHPVVANERSFDPEACNGTNRIDLHVLPHPSGHLLLMAILDNLGKGASGVAIQNLNLMLGLAEGSGLTA